MHNPAHEDFRVAYKVAIGLRADLTIDEALFVARDVKAGTVEHRRLLCDVLFKHAAKMAPKKYGDRVKTEVSGPEDGPIETKMEIQIKLIPRKTDAELGPAPWPEDLAKRIASGQISAAEATSILRDRQERKEENAQNHKD